MIDTMSRRCEICDREFIDVESLQEHFHGRRHYFKELDSRTIYITDEFDGCLENLQEFLANFGKVESIRSRFKPLEIIFEKKETVDYLLSKPLDYNGKALKVTSLLALSQQKDNKSEDIFTKTTSDKLKELLSEDESFEDQLSQFLSNVQVSNEDIKNKYNRVLEILTSVFETSFPKCKTLKFGSTRTHLGFKNCDLDVFLDTGEPLSEDNNRPNAWTISRVFEEAKRLVNEERKIFSLIVPLPNSRVPIIKLIHRDTSISCDVSFNNANGIYNSKLIRDYLDSDPRLELVMLVIKFWAQKHLHMGPEKLTSFALIMLIIFYLEQAGIVPTLHQLRSSAVTREVDGWQINFDTLAIKTTKREMDIPHILFGFFEYYAKFDFANNIVCPLDGVPYPKKLFGDVQNLLPESMTGYVEYLKTARDPVKLNVDRAICIQDIFKLNTNLTSHIKQGKVTRFQQHCAATVKVCEASIRNQDYSSFLLDLLTSVNEKRKNYLKMVIRDKEMTCSFKMILEKQNPPGNHQDSFEDRFDRAVELLKKIFLEVMKFHVEVSCDRDKENNVSSDSRSNDEVTFRCTGNQALWRKRNLESLSDLNLSQLDKEILVSDKMVKEVASKKLDTLIDFSCLVKKGTGKQPHAVIQFTNKGTDEGIFEELCNYFAISIPRIVLRTMHYMSQHRDASASAE